MIESAIGRRQATTERITSAAQRLTDAHGLDGFTMDDLAGEAGVSRRTLFNYFPSKLDAVLGEWPDLAEADIACFVAGGPDHDLVQDLRTLVAPMLRDRVTDRASLAVGRRILQREPRLMVAVHQRYEAISTTVVELVARREGPTFGALRARVAIGLLAALFDTALDEFLDDEQDRPFLEHFDAGLRTARTLLGG